MKWILLNISVIALSVAFASCGNIEGGLTDSVEQYSEESAMPPDYQPKDVLSDIGTFEDESLVYSDEAAITPFPVTPNYDEKQYPFHETVANNGLNPNSATQFSTDLSPDRTDPDWKEPRIYIKQDALYLKVDSGREVMIKGPFYYGRMYGYAYSGMNVVYEQEDGIYSDNENNTYRKISEDTTSRSIVIHDDWIYYCNRDGIYRMRLNGSELARLTEVDCHEIAVVDGYVFYIKYDSPDPDFFSTGDNAPPFPYGWLFRMNDDGSAHIDVGVWVSQPWSYDHMIYYFDPYDTVIYQLDPQTLVRTEFYECGGFIYGPLIHEGNGYFTRHNGDVFKISLAERRLETLRENGWHSIIDVVDGYVYFTDQWLQFRDYPDVDTWVLARMRTDGSGFERLSRYSGGDEPWIELPLP